MSLDIMRPVDLILQDGSTISYNSLRDLGSNLGINPHKLHRAAESGMHVDPNGLLFVKVIYRHMPEISIKEEPQKKKVPEPQKKNQREKASHSKPMIVTFADGTSTKYDSISDCALGLGVARETVVRALRSAKPTSSGIKIKAIK